MPFSFSVPASLSPHASSAFRTNQRPVGRRSGTAAVLPSIVTIAAASLSRHTSAMLARSVRGCHIGGFLAALVLAMTVNASQAAVVITFQEQGNDVVATASGTLNLAALTLRNNGNFSGGFLGPAAAVIVLGPTSNTSPFDGYTDITVSGGFGAGSFLPTTTFSGDYVGAFSNQLRVPDGYVSGTAISSTATWANTDFATLGVTPGDYVWSWGSGGNADTLTLSASAVPEPSTWALSAFALACGGWQLTRRRRALREKA